ncbi:3-oxoadipate enol-lactonase [Prauserella oleivorans]|uniref:3-oxoadipate enol-lactonase n=1 Tax=Prauserella oleivorans TaxID=1478153 RepID=A0ABW5W582_9PSEU
MPVLLQHDVHGPDDAPPLVLSGSVGSTIDMWAPNVPALAARFRVVRLNHRGHGRSPAPPGPYHIEDLAEDALATLDALGIERFAWCGLSMGAMIGMAIATQQPERLDALVLCCTSARLADTSVWRERAERVAREGTRPLAPEIVRRWFTERWARHHPAEVARARSWVATTSDDAYRNCCDAIAEWDHLERLPAITAPTLVLAGEHDIATPPEPDATTLADRIPDARLEILDAAHLATMEAPAAADHALLRHLLR